jgi:hypothetical protein
VLSVLAFAAILFLVAVVSLALPLSGLAEKTFIACRELWLLLVAVTLLRASR